MALDSWQRDFNMLDKEQGKLDTLQGNIVSTFQAGTFFGALLSFPLAEKIGRKKSIMIASLVFLVGGILMVCYPFFMLAEANVPRLLPTVNSACSSVAAQSLDSVLALSPSSSLSTSQKHHLLPFVEGLSESSRFSLKAAVCLASGSTTPAIRQLM